MSLTEIRHDERSALLATLEQVGPNAPTLCLRWTTADIAGHLVVSERYFGLPLVIGYPLRKALPISGRERLMRSLQAVGERQIESCKVKGWDWMVARLRVGLPRLYGLSSMAPLRLVEEWIHHEDVRRANGMGLRTAPSELNDALWQAGLFLVRLPEFLHGRQGLEVRVPGGRSHRLGDTTQVRVAGAPGEILLFLSGRTTAARVDVSGEEPAIQQLTKGLAV